MPFSVSQDADWPLEAADRVITRCITRSLSVPGATIRAMPGDPGRLPAPACPAAPGPAAVAGELLGRARAELSAGWGSGSRPEG
jgi:hypothetical protein